jgi:putative efflux protein, MATE family
MLQKYFGDKPFWRDILRLALPIALQNLLMSSFTMLDTIMVGQLGDVPLAAIGMAGQWSWLLNLVLFGFSSGSAVFISQYWGIKDKKKIHGIFGIQLIHAVIVSAIFAVVAIIFPQFVMRLFNKTPEVIEAGASYLRYAGLSYIGVAINGACCTLLRSTENVKLPLYINGFAAVFNGLMNYVLIFGKFGFPKMGIAGAAAATVISAWLCPIILIIVAIRTKNIMYVKLRNLFSFNKAVLMKFYKISSPVIINESMWGLGTFCYNMIFGHMSYENYAAVTIFRTVEGIAFVFFVGLCNACCVMVGKSIGAGHIEDGVKTSLRFTVIMPILGLILGTAMILMREPIIHIFNMTGAITEVTKNGVRGIMLVFGTEYCIRQIPYILIVGVFRPGGDTFTGMKYDMICVWLIALPLTFISGILLQLPFPIVFAIMLYSEDVVKVIMCIRHYRSKKWIMPITEEGKKAANQKT